MCTGICADVRGHSDRPDCATASLPRESVGSAMIQFVRCAAPTQPPGPRACFHRELTQPCRLQCETALQRCVNAAIPLEFARCCRREHAAVLVGVAARAVERGLQVT